MKFFDELKLIIGETHNIVSFRLHFLFCCRIVFYELINGDLNCRLNMNTFALRPLFLCDEY